MALIKSVRGFTPQIGKDTFLADNATIIVADLNRRFFV